MTESAPTRHGAGGFDIPLESFWQVVSFLQEAPGVACIWMKPVHLWVEGKSDGANLYLWEYAPVSRTYHPEQDYTLKVTWDGTNFVAQTRPDLVSTPPKGALAHQWDPTNRILDHDRTRTNVILIDATGARLFAPAEDMPMESSTVVPGPGEGAQLV